MGNISRVISWSLTFFLLIYPKWYFTSPENDSYSSSSSIFYKNYLKITWAGLSNTQCKVFNLPLWAIPKTKFSTPDSAATSVNSSRAETAEFNPSNLSNYPEFD